MKYAKFDASGVLVAHYESEINDIVDEDGVLRPEFSDLAAMTQEMYNRMIFEVDGTWKLRGGLIVKDALPAPTTDEIKQRLISAMQSHMDAAAQARGYDNIINAALRAGYPGLFHAEGLAFATWMDACWSLGYELLAEVKAGKRAVPAREELIGLLPALVL